jgi:hypothetical protein
MSILSNNARDALERLIDVNASNQRMSVASQCVLRHLEQEILSILAQVAAAGNERAQSRAFSQIVGGLEIHYIRVVRDLEERGERADLSAGIAERYAAGE